MPRIIIHGVRPTVSAHSLARTVQQYTGLPLPEAQRVVDRARAGERVEMEIDDEYAAYDLAALLSDLGATAEVDESQSRPRFTVERIRAAPPHGVRLFVRPIRYPLPAEQSRSQADRRGHRCAPLSKRERSQSSTRGTTYLFENIKHLRNMVAGFNRTE